MEFGEIETNKGVISFVGENLEVGMEVYLNDEPAEDGEYETEAAVFVVADGKVAEIREKEVPAAPEEEVAPEEAPAEEVAAEEEAKPSEEVAEVVEEIVDPEPDIVEILRPLVDEIKTIKADVDALKARLAEIEEKLLEDVAKPASEEFKEAKNGKSNFYRN